MDSSFDADFIIIGSGFGGAVSALRLAERGYSVVVLEQGKRYRTEDFPRTNWSLRKYLWAPRLGLHGIQVLTLLRHVLVLHGRGVGGGSLVYANTLVEPDESAFEQPGWGGNGWRARLAPHYAEARRMLGAVRCPDVGVMDDMLREVATELHGADTFRVHDLGVFFGEAGVEEEDPFFDGSGPDRTGCTRCGACMIGCPVGAKNTLDKNYLWLAERLGVRIVPETEALGIEPVDGGYVVHTRRSLGLRRPRRTWRAQRVVVSGGVIGSVRLLMESRTKGWLTRLSPQLGKRVRTNSEAILAADSRVRGADYSGHVAITSGAYIDDRTYVEMVRYNRGSDPMFWLTFPLVGRGARGNRILGLLGALVRRPFQFLRGLWPLGRAARSGIVLAMQPTDGHLDLELTGRWGRLSGVGIRSRLPEGEKPPVAHIPVANEVARQMADRMKGDAWSALSDVVLRAPTTAHILGGCLMGRSSESAVVDEAGEVFGHPGIYVVDGSVVPVNLGVNPSLTITALAEYMMAKMPHNVASGVVRSF